MKLVLISGRSGSGKSTALAVLEDIGFYCIDNLPTSLLPALIETTQRKQIDSRLAICIDARNHAEDIRTLSSIRKSLPKNVDIEVIYLDADNDVLIKRFSETRRRHPLSSNHLSLSDALFKEQEILSPVALMADLHINTNTLNVHSLREQIKNRVQPRLEQGGMSITFTSFGFKNGIPVDADIVYDVRCLPNPHWVPELRELHGTDSDIIAFLDQQDDVNLMFNDIKNYLNNWLPKFIDNNRSYLTIAIGCTGGRHRSVYLSERLCAYFQQHYHIVQINHRESY